jgi:hypothetical protein
MVLPKCQKDPMCDLSEKTNRPTKITLQKKKVNLLI